MNINESAAIAKKASIVLANCSSDLKNKALIEISKALFERQADIIKANKEDLELLHEPMAGIAEEIANAEENA